MNVKIGLTETGNVVIYNEITTTKTTFTAELPCFLYKDPNDENNYILNPVIDSVITAETIITMDKKLFVYSGIDPRAEFIEFYETSHKEFMKAIKG